MNIAFKARRSANSVSSLASANRATEVFSHLLLRRCLFAVALLAVSLFLAGCASTEIVNQWSDSAYRPRVFRRIIVLGVSKQASIRRTFEDEFVSQLKAAGHDAVPSYGYIAEDGQAGEAVIREAVRKAAADAAIMTRLLGVEQRRRVTPGYYQPIHPYGFYGWYSSAWYGYYEPPRVYQYEVYTSETSLYDMVKNQIVWTGTAQTTAPGEVRREIRNYVAIVLNALKHQRIL